MNAREERAGSVSRREFLKRSLYGGGTVALATLAPFPGCGLFDSRRTATNFILISIDTLRADHLGCYGYPRSVSPAIDRFAAGGVLFEDVTSPAPWTLPAHTSMLTGLYPSRHGVKSLTQRLDDSVPTLAEILADHGFRTAAFVNCSHLNRKHGLHRGFDEFRYIFRSAGEIHPSRIGDLALRWLDGAGGGRFFLFLHFYDVHSDYRSKETYEKQFVRAYSGEADGTTAQFKRFRDGEIVFGDDDATHLVDLYDAQIRQIDDMMKRLFRKIDATGRFDDTVVMITSDHGEEFLEHGGVLHGRTHYREVSRVPLLIRGPGAAGGARIREPASLIDIVPTALSNLELPAYNDADGIDLNAGRRRGHGRRKERRLFAEADHNNAVRDSRRLVRDRRFTCHVDLVTGTVRLFDLARDPREKNDIGAGHPEKVKYFQKELEAFMDTKGAAAPEVELSPAEIERLKSLGYVK